ncbi:NADH-quinone oxidoreductase subunit B, partial [Xanthomonas citri pv. citri]|nr:NADH-quinone oxidoreductase subunit B [Xanthomonas citri pv. citri]
EVEAAKEKQALDAKTTLEQKGLMR